MASPDSPNAEPPSIDPYAVLQLPTTASADDIKRTYRKQALRLHPDKAPPADRETAHQAFQELALAYAVLSDARRRARYDATGSTAETLDLDDGAFDWRDFFRAQFAEVVTEQKIDELKAEYQGSPEERADVLKWYAECEGEMRRVFEGVMLSDILDDEPRFRRYIDEAITKGEVEAYDMYVNESEKSRKRRVKKAEKERREAEEHAKDLNLNCEKSKKGKGKGKGGGGGLADLATMIQQRGAARVNTFLDDIEAKYAGGRATNGAKRKSHMDEPPEEAFAEMGKRKRKAVDEVHEAAPKKASGKKKLAKKAKAS